MTRSLELAARKLGRAGWSSVVTILLVEGKELLAMDEEGTSDPYCKFRLVLAFYKMQLKRGKYHPSFLFNESIVKCSELLCFFQYSITNLQFAVSHLCISIFNILSVYF